ncbi:MAG: PKD domain-containing protein [Thermoplasmatota archaeon]
MSARVATLTLALFLVAAAVAPGLSAPAPLKLIKHLMPVRHASGPPPPAAGNMGYGSGPVQTVPHVYVVYWGFNIPAVDDPAGEAPYLTGFLSAMGGSGWTAIMTQYYETGPTYITNPLSPFNSATDVWYDNTVTDLPGVLPDALIASEAARAATHFGYSANADYIIATPHGRNTAEFGLPVANVGYCAWHSTVSTTAGIVSFTNLPYIPDAQLGVCGAGFVNGATGPLDGVSIVAGHEYAETVTDPQPLSGWADSSGQEIGDKCAWVTTGAGATQNVAFGASTYPVQGLWSNAASGCVITYGYHAKAGGPYTTEVGKTVPIAATSIDGVGADSCTWSGAGATFGSSTACSTTVSYAATGTKTMSLTMTDSNVPVDTDTTTGTVTVNAALTASAGGPYSGIVGAAIPITGTPAAGVAPYTCAWTGVGATFANAAACATTVSYTSAGSKTVSLSVSDARSATATSSATVTVSSAALAANAGGPYSGMASIPIAISGAGSGGTPPYSCAWTGAGATFASASSCSTTVKYTAAGTDTITLTVTDGVAATATSTATVTVASSCTTDPTGDQEVPALDPLGLFDITNICAKRTATNLEVAITTAGLTTDNALGTGVDPVVYKVAVNSMGGSWDVYRAGGQFTVVNENGLLLTGATATASATAVTVDIPLSQITPFTGYRVQTSIAGNSHGAGAQQIDTAPNTGFQTV